MKRFIAGLIVGLLITATTAVAATSFYWQRGGSTYTCEGIYTGVRCKETNWKPAYAVHILPGSIIVSFKGKPIFSCDRGVYPADNCSYYGP